MTEYRDINKILVGSRIRKDLGDITSLQDSIFFSGLLHPIVIDRKNKLIAGRRRLQAFKNLSKTYPKYLRIPVRVLDVPDKIRAELEENSIRKNFTIAEIADITSKVSKTRIGHRMKKKDGKMPHNAGKTRDIVSSITNQSPRQIDKINDISRAAKKDKKFADIVRRVDAGTLSVNSAHKLITQKTRNLPSVPLPKGEFDVIYADPALRFENRNIRGSADHHYKTMSLENIMKLKIPSAKNAVLFIWIPSSMMFDEMDAPRIEKPYDVITKKSTLTWILEAWKFKAKTFFVWDKEMIGTGSYHRNQHENLVIAFKGKMPTPAKLFSSIIRSKRTKHSEKPHVVYSMIEAMYPKRKYLELFARNSRKGWVSWGNQVSKHD